MYFSPNILRHKHLPVLGIYKFSNTSIRTSQKNLWCTSEVVKSHFHFTDEKKKKVKWDSIFFPDLEVYRNVWGFTRFLDYLLSLSAQKGFGIGVIWDLQEKHPKFTGDLQENHPKFGLSLWYYGPSVQSLFKWKVSPALRVITVTQSTLK